MRGYRGGITFIRFERRLADGVIAKKSPRFWPILSRFLESRDEILEEPCDHIYLASFDDINGSKSCGDSDKPPTKCHYIRIMASAPAPVALLWLEAMRRLHVSNSGVQVDLPTQTRPKPSTFAPVWGL